MDFEQSGWKKRRVLLFSRKEPTKIIIEKITAPISIYKRAIWKQILVLHEIYILFYASIVKCYSQIRSTTSVDDSTDYRKLRYIFIKQKIHILVSNDTKKIQLMNIILIFYWIEQHTR